MSFCHFTFKSPKPETTNFPTKLSSPLGFPILQEASQFSQVTQVWCVDHVRFYPSQRPLSLISLQVLLFHFSVLVLCFSSPWPHSSLVALKLSSRDPWESPRLFQGVRGSNDFHDKFRVLLAFFTFSHKQRVDFSRAHMSCDVTTNWMPDNWIYDNSAGFY